MKSVPITEFKAKCLAILEGVAQTGEPVVVLKRGKPIARVTSAASGAERYPQDSLHGTVETVGDIVSPVLPPGAWSALATAPPRGRAKKKRRSQ
jgi:prevent-host-death family protein